MAHTLIHTLVENCRAGKLATCVARLPSGWVIMGERQVLAGYCLLLPDPVVPDLNALDSGARSRFLLDMSAVGDALLQITGAARINYAIYGNLEPALHAHIFPRSAQEPEATRTAQPWGLDWAAAPPYSDSVHGALKNSLKQALSAAQSQG
jgi:diadenosine tetraphosphate (Ap4A) HIT family hydrolase